MTDCIASETVAALLARPVRAAEPSDEPLFMDLWFEYLKEGFVEDWGDMLPTAHTLHFFDLVFQNVVSGSVPGVCLFGADGNAVLLWSSVGELFDSRFGKTMHGWGTYVRREHRRLGWSQHMWQEGTRRARALGFDTLINATHSGNDIGQKASAAFGFRPYQSLGYLSLKEV